MKNIDGNFTHIALYIKFIFSIKITKGYIIRKHRNNIKKSSNDYFEIIYIINF